MQLDNEEDYLTDLPSETRSDATDAWCFVPNNVWDSEKNKQRDLLFDGLKSIKYNSDSEELELMVNAPSMAYIIWVLWSVFWTVLSDKEGEKGNNKNSATGNNCTVISKKTK